MIFSKQRAFHRWPCVIGSASALFAGATCSGQAQQYTLEQPQAQETGPQHRFDALRDDALAKFLNVGPFNIRPHFVGAGFYDDNISLAPKGQGREILKDVVWSLSPGVTAAIGEFHAGKRGNYLSLDYTPTATLYTDHGEFNALDHNVRFDGGWRGSKLALGVGQSYMTGSGGFAETGGQVEREVYNTGLNAHYDFSDKTSFDLNGRQVISSFQTRNKSDASAGNNDLDSRNEWSVEAVGDYKLSDKVKLGAGVVTGWRDIRSSPNESYQQLLARGGYLVTEKVDVSLAVGAQWSQFQGGLDEGPKFIFDLGGTWQVRERTSLSLDLFRREQSSVAFSAQSYTVVGFRASVRQTIGQKWVAGLGGGFEHSDYFETTSGASTSQDNDYWFVGPSLDYNFSDQWTVGLFYQYREKDSDDASFGFANNQAGLRTTFRF
jgi:hypothetical protein